MRQDARGLTLLELLVAIAVMGVLLGVGVPSFQSLQRSMAASSAFHLFTTSLATARATAVTRGVPVSLCPSVDGQQCQKSTSWDQGWIVFEDSAHKTQPASPDSVLHRFTGLDHGMVLRSTAGRTLVRFHPSGMAPGTNVSMRLCSFADQRYLGSVILNNAGRPRTERKADATCPFAL